MCDLMPVSSPQILCLPLAFKTMEFPWHSGKVLEQLNRQRKQGLLCDCTFVVDGVDFKAHKAVLAACSVYFRTLFQDQKDVVHLDISNAAGGSRQPVLADFHITYQSGFVTFIFQCFAHQ